MRKNLWKTVLLLLVFFCFSAGITVQASEWPPSDGQEAFYLDTKERDQAIFEPSSLNPDTAKEDIEKILLQDVNFIYAQNTTGGYDKVDVVSQDTPDKSGKAWFYQNIRVDDDYSFSSVEGSRFSWSVTVAKGNPDPQQEIDWDCLMTWYREVNYAPPSLENAVVSYADGYTGTLNAVVQTFISEIDSYLIPVTLDGEILDPDTYRVTLRQEKGKYYLQGLAAVSSYYQDSPNYFADHNIKVEVHPLEKYPLDSRKVNIFVNDSKCTFASEEAMKPKVQISLGTTVLTEGIDYRIEYLTPSTIESNGKLKIYALDTSESIQAPESGSYLVRPYVCHLADIKDYYTLEGITEELVFQGSGLPILLQNSGTGTYTETDLKNSGAVYLKPIPGKITSWHLPKISTAGVAENKLYDGSYYLNISYSFDGIHFSSNLNHSSEEAQQALKAQKAYVKVSVSRIGNKYNTSPNEYSREYCYLDGSIIKEIPFVTRSLDEVNPDQYPPTAPDADDNYSLAFLNTIKSDSQYPNLPEYKDSPLANVVYNGEEHRPALNIGIFFYPLPALGAEPALIPGIISYPADSKYIESIDYTDNINVGTGKVTVRFRGGFTGSVTRTFEITPADISSAQVRVLENPSYHGKPSLPKLEVKLGQKVLSEQTDYTLSVSPESDGISYGSQKAVITGTGNYKGSLTKEYQVLEGSLSDQDLIEIQVSDLTYSGSASLPKVIVRDVVQNQILSEGADYTLSLDTTADNINAGRGRVLVEGKGRFQNSIALVDFSILPKDLSGKNAVEIIPDKAFYTGQQVLPLVTVTDPARGVVLKRTSDYTIEASAANIEIGKGRAKISGIGNYKGMSEIEFTIESSHLPLIDPIPDQVYTGSKAQPDVSIPGLVKDVDYTVSYENNVDAGTALATVTFIKNYRGTTAKSFTILPKDFGTDLQLQIRNAVYTGRPVLPQITVRDLTHGRILVENADYKISSAQDSANIEPGQGTALITGIGNYSGTKSVNFTIEKEITETPAKTDPFVVIQRNETNLKLYWNKLKNVTGYQIYMAAKENGSYREVLTTKKRRGRIKNLKHSRTYYFKLRGYTVKNGIYSYGEFSSPMAIGTKLKKPVIALSAKKKSVTISFKPIPKAEGYQIWMKVSAKGTWSPIQKVIMPNGKKKISYTIKKLKSGAIPYIRVRGYRMVNGKQLYSPKSTVQKIKVK